MVLRRLLAVLSFGDRAAEQVRLENLVLRHQVVILRRQVKRPIYRMRDRALLAAASRMLLRERWNAFLVRPETLLRWHRGLVAQKWTHEERIPALAEQHAACGSQQCAIPHPVSGALHLTAQD